MSTLSPEGRPALTDGEGVSLDIAPSKDEEKLNEFVRLHPMLSLDALNKPTLQQLSDMVERAPIRVERLEVVSKSYEDSLLRPARHDRGERSCVLGEQCLCKFMAHLRYGKDTTRGFICTEFLLPSARNAWLEGKGLPERQQKCLVCLRYFVTYMYYTARSDQEYGEMLMRFRLQTHTNPCDESNAHESGKRVRKSSRRGALDHHPLSTCGFASGDKEWHQCRLDECTLPTHCNTIDVQDGYRRDAMLGVDEDCMSCVPFRTDRIGATMFRPFVRFSSSFYRYDRVGGDPCLVQVGVAAHLNGCPPLDQVERAVGMQTENTPFCLDH